MSTDRLLLPLITADDAQAVLTGARRPQWAADFPSAGDLAIAGLLDRVGVPTGPDRVFGARHITERSSGTVVGGVGLFGPPEDGRVEIGYGLVGSRQGRGYATEAARCLIAFALAQPGVDDVVATVEPDNLASVRVLERSGLVLHQRRPALLVYRLSAGG